MMPEKMRKILVTGGTGLLGKGLVETWPGDCEIVSIHMRDYNVEDKVASHRVVDIRYKSDVERLFAENQFDVVIHAAGIANVDYVEKNYAESLESNLVGTLNIISACRQAGAYLIYVSTNAVFDGTEAPYRESAVVNPVNKYGRLKVECERLVRETLTQFSIVRPILMYGWNHSQVRSNPASALYAKLSKGEQVRMVTDVHENPLFNLQCGTALWQIMKAKPSGVFHLAGGEIVTRYEFALQFAKEFGFDPKLIVPVDSSFFPAIAPRPKNTSFVTERMEKELSVKALSVAEGLRAMKRALLVKA